VPMPMMRVAIDRMPCGEALYAREKWLVSC